MGDWELPCLTMLRVCPRTINHELPERTHLLITLLLFTSDSCKESLPETLSPKVTKWWEEEEKANGEMAAEETCSIFGIRHPC